MEDPAEKRHLNNPDSVKEREETIGRERSGRKSAASGEETKKTSYRDHKNPVIRALSRTGYTVWIIVMGIGLLLAFIVSVALL
ncbi:hypothetical protein RM545_16275 [Zunongwangia sp. F260]|uniref:Uncharacterized protein n=1 Tax=Autumnicola lenta TaxID=3075593 RepID=A0ABU3CPJ9_9FLAO|nr:hypothetical protein [Zunongwangia sp. F260]MDT0648251.1 hypothetical protein [Zunongwangia sp. F260]